MSQLHQEALRRQHVVDKRNVNDLSWLVSTNSQLRASVLFAMNYQKIISSSEVQNSWHVSGQRKQRFCACCWFCYVYFADKCKAEPYFLGLHFSLKITSVCVGQCTDYMKNFNDCFMSALQTLCMWLKSDEFN